MKTEEEIARSLQWLNAMKKQTGLSNVEEGKRQALEWVLDLDP